MQENSSPNLDNFIPVIPYQKQLILNIRKNFDYSLGAHEVLLSGSIGSAKSTIAAHLALTHCLFYSGARVLLCRRSLPDLKRTIFSKILETIHGSLKEGSDYRVNTTQASVKFSNGSEILSGSWADKRYMKFRSLDLSAAIFEEIVENEGDDVQAYKEVKMRIGRLPHINENWILSCTNPSAPSSYWYKYFIESQSKTRHVMYSVTTDNPFLPEKYIEQLKMDMDAKEAQRMIYGKWIEITQEVIYYNYERDRNFIDKPYTWNNAYPICLSFDFNIADNKPMSALAGQYIDGIFHAAKDFVVEGARTQDICDEIIESGIFKNNNKVEVYGDASGKARDTRSTKSDYDIILKALANVEPKLNIKNHVPLSNPPIRERHNITNAMFLDANSKISTYVYNEALVLDKGLRLSKIKQGGRYIEDDSKPYQHVTTCYSYWIHYTKKRLNTTPTRIQHLF